jgi:hypothetical protein
MRLSLMSAGVVIACIVFQTAHADEQLMQSIFKSDTAPYVAMGVSVDTTVSCGLRTKKWGTDAHAAIVDKFSYFAANLFGSDSNSAQESKYAERDVEDTMFTASENGPQPSPDVCLHLDDKGTMEKIDTLIIQDQNLGSAVARDDGVPASNGMLAPPHRRKRLHNRTTAMICAFG